MQFEAHDQNIASVAPPRESAREIAPPIQLKLFEVQPHPIVEELRKLDPNTLTPLEALNKIYEWRRSLLGNNFEACAK